MEASASSAKIQVKWWRRETTRVQQSSVHIPAVFHLLGVPPIAKAVLINFDKGLVRLAELIIELRKDVGWSPKLWEHMNSRN